MKERIVIEKEVLERLIKALPIQWFDNKEKGKLVIFGKEYQIEKEPTNWEELKELVNKYSGKINRQVGGITVGTTRIIIMMEFDNIYFGRNGNIYFAEKYLGTYTPARQWQIIKSLIGEE